MLYSEQIKQFAEKLGVDTAQLKDGLYSTTLKAIYDACGSGGGSGGGGVSSWNDIPDRPFGTTTTIQEILPETKVLEVEGTLVVMAVPTLVDGNTYTVTWNGVDYTCVAHTTEGLTVVGDIGAMTGGESTGEPFVIAPMIRQGFTMVASFNGETDITLSIRGEVKEVTQLEVKYLPQILIDVSSGDYSLISRVTYDEVIAALNEGKNVVIRVIDTNTYEPIEWIPIANIDSGYDEQHRIFFIGINARTRYDGTTVQLDVHSVYLYKDAYGATQTGYLSSVTLKTV